MLLGMVAAPILAGIIGWLFLTFMLTRYYET